MAQLWTARPSAVIRPRKAPCPSTLDVIHGLESLASAQVGSMRKRGVAWVSDEGGGPECFAEDVPV